MVVSRQNPGRGRQQAAGALLRQAGRLEASIVPAGAETRQVRVPEPMQAEAGGGRCAAGPERQAGRHKREEWWQEVVRAGEQKTPQEWQQETRQKRVPGVQSRRTKRGWQERQVSSRNAVEIPSLPLLPGEKMRQR